MLKHRISLALLSCTLLASYSAHAACEHDRERLLALDENQFDQDLSGGWRTLDNPSCRLVAADLLRDYRQTHKSETSILYWHEGQLRADAGQTAAAIALMEQSRKPAAVDLMGWNPYVDATVAFLRRDKAALDKARATLAAVQVPEGVGLPPVVNGFLEAPTADGTMLKMRWPVNIDVVDGLVHCFDKPYEVAYANECRPSSK